MQPIPKRPESDALMMNELKMVFGGKEYKVPVLRSKQAALWRAEYFARTKDVSDSMPQHFEKADDPKELSKALNSAVFGALQRYPEKVPELIFSYASCLEPHREEISEAAYDADYSRAFAQIWQVAFGPFLGSLGMVIEMQRAQESASLSPAGSN